MSSDDALDQRDALIATLNAAHPDANPLTPDELEEQKEQLPAHYTEVYVTERISEIARYGGRDGARSWRAQFRAVGQYEHNAQRVRQWIRDTFEDKSIEVGGVPTTAFVRGATDDPIRPDDGWFSGLSEFTYYC